jgi:energy-coupling factor transport system ATP-binding protein
VALAAALVTRPQLVLLDEPTSQLDPVAGDELIWLLRRLNEEWGVTILLAEHRLERCLAAADRVVAMDGGRIAFDGAPRDFLGWAQDSDPALETPAARMFSLANISPLPTGVRDARQTLIGFDHGRRGAGAPPRSTFSVEAERNSPSDAEKVQAARRGTGTPSSTALRLKDVWVELGDADERRDVLRGVDLAVGRGERVSLMGRNGAGKSTLLRAVAGLQTSCAERSTSPMAWRC